MYCRQCMDKGYIIDWQKVAQYFIIFYVDIKDWSNFYTPCDCKKEEI